MRFSRSTGGKKGRLRDRISPRAVRGDPGGGPRAVPGVPRASQRRKFVAQQLELIQPSLYEYQTLSKNWTIAPKRLGLEPSPLVVPGAPLDRLWGNSRLATLQTPIGVKGRVPASDCAYCALVFKA
jgi:hypothetical protein